MKSTMSKKSIYSLIPSNATKVGINIQTQSIVVITPAQTKDINVQLDKRSFRATNCDSCEFKVTEKELTASMKAAKILCSSLNKISYCNNNNLCTATDQMLSLCPAGHKIDTTQTITVNVPQLLWEYNPQKTGKEVFKLFAFNENNEVTPYYFSNVYNNPLACISWPKNQTRPSNLRQAYNTYWNSPFSDESMVIDPANPHQTFVEHLLSYTPSTNDSWTTFSDSSYVWLNPTDGIFFSNDSAVINSLPQRVWSNPNYVYGTIKQGENNQWLITINDHLFTKTGKLSGTSKLNLIGKV